jgi:hypothetical protein
MEANQNTICRGPLPRQPNPNGAADCSNEGPTGQEGPRPDAPEGGAHRASPSHPPAGDYAAPRALADDQELIWDEDDLALDNYRALARRLAAAGDLYRRPAYAGGLLLASPLPNIEPLGLLQVRVYDEVARPEELDGPWPAGEGLLTVIRLERCGQPVIPGPDEDLLDLDPDPDRPLVGRRVLLERRPCGPAGDPASEWSLCECSLQDDMHRWELYMRRVRRRQEEDGSGKN